jgi:hypothetical protein
MGTVCYVLRAINVRFKAVATIRIHDMIVNSKHESYTTLLRFLMSLVFNL